MCLSSHTVTLGHPETACVRRGKGGLSKQDKDKLKLAGAAVAVVAAIALGASKVCCLRQSTAAAVLELAGAV